MKIVDVRALQLMVEYEHPFWSATHLQMNPNLKTRSSIPAVIVEIETDTGLVGIGQPSALPLPASTTKAVIEQELKIYLMGQDPEYVERLWDQIYRGTFQHGRRGIMINCLSGVDIALWDLLGKAYGQPVYKLLGAYTDRVEAYATAGMYAQGKTVNDLAAEMKGLAEQGYRGVKIKIGALSVEDDMRRVAAVREAIGPNVKLYVDSNRTYDLKTAMRVAKRLEEYNVGFFEEPVTPDDVDASARLAASTSVPIAGYETEVGRFAYRDLITRRAVDLVQVDVIWTGGFSECRKIAHMAAACGLDCVAHAYGSPLTLMANMHLVASLANARAVEVDCTARPLVDGLLKNPPRIEPDGFLTLPQGPGLGVELDPEFVKEHLVD